MRIAWETFSFVSRETLYTALRRTIWLPFRIVTRKANAGLGYRFCRVLAGLFTCQRSLQTYVLLSIVIHQIAKKRLKIFSQKKELQVKLC